MLYLQNGITLHNKEIWSADIKTNLDESKNYVLKERCKTIYKVYLPMYINFEKKKNNPMV